MATPEVEVSQGGRMHESMYDRAHEAGVPQIHNPSQPRWQAVDTACRHCLLLKHRLCRLAKAFCSISSFGHLDTLQRSSTISAICHEKWHEGDPNVVASVIQCDCVLL